MYKYLPKSKKIELAEPVNDKRTWAVTETALPVSIITGVTYYTLASFKSDLIASSTIATLVATSAFIASRLDIHGKVIRAVDNITRHIPLVTAQALITGLIAGGLEGYFKLNVATNNGWYLGFVCATVAFTVGSEIAFRMTGNPRNLP